MIRNFQGWYFVTFRLEPEQDIGVASTARRGETSPGIYRADQLLRDAILLIVFPLPKQMNHEKVSEAIRQASRSNIPLVVLFHESHKQQLFLCVKEALNRELVPKRVGESLNHQKLAGYIVGTAQPDITHDQVKFAEEVFGVSNRELPPDWKPPPQIPDTQESEIPQPSTLPVHPDRVFVVHGHHGSMKYQVKSVLETLGLNPILLDEQAGGGRTIIEKIEDNSDVKFAVVLLSPDDLCYQKSEDPNKAKPRARQNVILELGYFIGKLGRSRVCALFHAEDELEIPSDYLGVEYIPFNSGGGWKLKLSQELHQAGFNIDTNDLVRDK